MLSSQQPAHIGYFQGMNFVTAVFFIAMLCNEELAFWGLVQLFSRHGLSKLYDTKSMLFKQMSLRVETQLYKEMPALALHLFEQLDFNLEVYTVRWFFSLFCIDLPVDLVLRILDMYLVQSFDIFPRASLAIFKRVQLELLACRDLEETNWVLRSL